MMRLIAAFLKLVRLPNLLFIVLAQLLFQFCIYTPLYANEIPDGDRLGFTLLLLASVCIAAAGYIINDYFDVNIDEVNKPGKLVVDKIIHRRWAIAWHFMLNSLGLLFTMLALPLREKWYLVLANMACMALLWFYSTSFKRQLLVGNIVISLLSAWTILVIFFSKLSLADAFGLGRELHDKFFRLAFLYAGFAFISSLVREAIKDLEDMPGDARYGCRTMPLVWGMHATKVYTAVWLIVLIALLVLVQFYVLQFGWWEPVVYSVGLILAPLGYVLATLFRSQTPAAFHRLSNIMKLVMLTGIVSMLFFCVRL
ncbi:MAG TPA: geranylgeranylglycerol-phosphate geranylgeranyltransferase [Chitinophagaceae bacterium]|nr:geranylgeranylglycerol-phosphate geranylgeranyltransferase [Chitinophagaceae bacterium]